MTEEQPVSEIPFPLSPEVLAGDTSDVYFLRTHRVMELEGVNPRVTMEFFPSGDGILCGMKEVLALLRQSLPSDAEVWALEEGERFRVKEIVLRVIAPYLSFGVYETAILGILAAVVIPNVGRFIGRGESEAQKAEYHDVGAAITAMMVENGLASIPNAIDATNDAIQDVTGFPDSTSVAGSADKATDPNGTAYTAVDDDGYVLFSHDMTGGGAAGPYVNYTNMSTTKYWYTCESDGTVRQWDSATVATRTELASAP